MRLDFWRHEPPRPKRPRREYVITIETGPDDRILAPYRDLLLDPVRSTMDYTKDCLLGRVRSECQKAQLLRDLYDQYQEDAPERSRKGLSGPDKMAFVALPVECQTCIVWKNAPGSDENLIKSVAEGPGAEPLAPTANDAHGPREVLSRALWSWTGSLMSRVRRDGESPEEAEEAEAAPRIRYRELADPEPPQDPEAVTPVPGPRSPMLQSEPGKEPEDRGGNQEQKERPHDTEEAPRPPGSEGAPKPKTKKKSKSKRKRSRPRPTTVSAPGPLATPGQNNATEISGGNTP